MSIPQGKLTLIDKDRITIRYDCPCGNNHATKLAIGSWSNGVDKIIKRKCAITETSVNIQMYDYKQDGVGTEYLAPFGEITNLGDIKIITECPDCKGSGKYIGFTVIEPCRTCTKPS